MERSKVWIGVVCGVALTVSACGSHPRYFRVDRAVFAGGAGLAVLPLVNLSRFEKAPDIVMNSLIVELLESKTFRVVDPGLVETVVLEKRLRLTDRLPLETLQELGERLGVEYLLVGSVNEFGFIQDGNANLPMVSISMRIIRATNGEIVWAATHSKRGDDAETVFGLGKIGTLEKLAAVTVREMATTLRR